MIEFLLSDHRALIQDFFALVLVAVALVWGGGPERVFAFTWLFLFELLGFLHRAVYDRPLTLDAIDPFLATIDIVALFVFLICALYANRNYMLWIAGMQVLAVSAHLARGMVEEISQISYAMMAYVPGWLQLIFFAVGLTRHLSRRRYFGAYRDWRIGNDWLGGIFVQERTQPWLAVLGHDFFPRKDRR